MKIKEYDLKVEGHLWGVHLHGNTKNNPQKSASGLLFAGVLLPAQCFHCAELGKLLKKDNNMVKNNNKINK